MTLRGSQDQQVVYFRFQSGLAVLSVRKPTEQELISLRIVELTSTQPWTPENEFSEDGKDLVPPLNDPLADAYGLVEIPDDDDQMKLVALRDSAVSGGTHAMVTWIIL